MTEMNSLGQPVGFAVPAWKAALNPPHSTMVGRYARLEPLCAEKHATDLYASQSEDREGRNWTYLSHYPPADVSAYQALVTAQATSTDPLFYAILDSTQRAVGVAAYLRIQPTAGSIEVGHINFSPRMQRTPVGTEAMVLMMRRAFEELGYRRYEWKCDNLNAPSRSAALRYGFQFEGVFRQDRVVKGRNRDTAWFSVIDSEWPALAQAFESWLDPDNFDDQGCQRQTLAHFRSLDG